MNLISREEALPLTPHAYYVLVALALRPLGRYDLYDQCTDDAQDQFSFNRKNLYRTIKNLEKWGFVRPKGEYGSAGSQYNRTVYQITSRGKLILEWETDRYHTISRIAEIRLCLLAKPVIPVTLGV